MTPFCKFGHYIENVLVATIEDVGKEEVLYPQLLNHIVLEEVKHEIQRKKQEMGSLDTGNGVSVV